MRSSAFTSGILYSIVPEDCIHGVHPQSQPFALHQFRSNAYNFNVTVSHSDDLQMASQNIPLQRASQLKPRCVRKLLFALAIAWLGFCVSPAAAQSLKVPFAALSPNYAPLWIAEQTGLFKKHGLDVQLIYISAGSVIVPAILSGQVEIANMSSAPALTAWARGAELSAVGVTSNRLLHVIMTRSSIKKPEDLEIKNRRGPLWLTVGSDLARSATLLQRAPDRDVAVIQTGGLPERLERSKPALSTVSLSPAIPLSKPRNWAFTS